MGMSDQDIGKKEVERSALGYFIDAYEWVTDEQLLNLALLNALILFVLACETNRGYSLSAFSPSFF